jgi:hypothetical protein
MDLIHKRDVVGGIFVILVITGVASNFMTGIKAGIFYFIIIIVFNFIRKVFL